MQPSDTPLNEANAALVERLTFALQAAEVGTWDYNLETGYAEWSPICKQLFGLAPDASVSAATLLAQVHPDDREWVALANKKSLSPDGDGQHNITFRTLADDGQQRWVHAKGKTFLNNEGRIVRFSGIAQDVTSSVDARQQLKANQERFRTLIEEAPVATCLFVGRELIIEVANDLMINFWGKDHTVIGKSLREAVPELAGQPFLQILDEVYTSGQTYEAQNTSAELPVNGISGIYYFDFTFKPLRNAQGEVYAILEMAVEVTERVLAQKRIESLQRQVLTSFEQSPVAIAIISENDLTFQMANPFYGELVGRRPDQIVGKPLLVALPELAGQGFDQLLKQVIATEKPYTAKEVAVDVVRHNQLETIYVDLIYQPQRDIGQDDPDRVTGILVVATNVTGQVQARQKVEESETRYRTLSAELEQQVQQRTQELAASNEELANMNEELMVANEELAESNRLFTRSNENLQQFAYIASHDLQEPLRKVQSFGDLLKNNYGDQLGNGVEYLERMQASAHRMSLFIKDLLAFSRISTYRDRTELVSLTGIVNVVLTDLELIIEETNGVVEIDALPMVKGDKSQLGQLFQNLISNALKFHRPGISPLIYIKNHQLTARDLPSSVKPTRVANVYHCISISDNGIGFDEKYLDRIFQIFQRLHGKSQFSGTGIGLAICEKVVANHGGAITARSRPGEGSIFSVYLPV
jgi:PAS domain S-box-containing protein